MNFIALYAEIRNQISFEFALFCLFIASNYTKCKNCLNAIKEEILKRTNDCFLRPVRVIFLATGENENFKKVFERRE